MVDMPHHRTLVGIAYKDIFALSEIPVISVVAFQIEYLSCHSRYVVILVRLHEWYFVG